MKILAFIEIKKTSREEFEAKFPKHSIKYINDRDFLWWCSMCPEPIFFGETFLYVDDDNQHLKDATSHRKAHAFHIYPEIER